MNKGNVKSGWIEIKPKTGISATANISRRRFVVLHNHNLEWFAQEGGGIPLQTIDVGKCVVSNSSADTFFLSVPYTNSEYRFKTATEQEATQWLSAITRAIHLAQVEEKKMEQSMTTFANKAGVKYQGWMEKSGKQYYFILENTLLTWYPSDPSEPNVNKSCLLSGSLSVVGAQIIQAGFDIRIVPTSAKTRVLKPSTQQEVQNWTTYLKLASLGGAADVSASSSNPVVATTYRGWVMRKNVGAAALMNKLQKRFLVLITDYLKYYDTDATNSLPKGELYLGGCQVVYTGAATFVVSSPARDDLIWICDDDNEAKLWVDVLSASAARVDFKISHAVTLHRWVKVKSQIKVTNIPKWIVLQKLTLLWFPEMVPVEHITNNHCEGSIYLPGCKIEGTVGGTFNITVSNPKFASATFSFSVSEESVYQEWMKMLERASRGEAFTHVRLVFGRTLEEVLERDKTEVPKVITRCCEFILEHGVNVQGILRKSGSATDIERWTAHLDEGKELVFPPSIDVNVVAGLLKSFLREMKEPLIPSSLYHTFISASNPRDMRSALGQLPPKHYPTVQYLCKFLYDLLQHQEVTSMDAVNIAIVIGPNILKPPGTADDAMSGLAETPNILKTTQRLIEKYYGIFERPVSSLANSTGIPLSKSNANISNSSTPNLSGSASTNVLASSNPPFSPRRVPDTPVRRRDLPGPPTDIPQGPPTDFVPAPPTDIPAPPPTDLPPSMPAFLSQPTPSSPPHRPLPQSSALSPRSPSHPYAAPGPTTPPNSPRQRSASDTPAIAHSPVSSIRAQPPLQSSKSYQAFNNSHSHQPLHASQPYHSPNSKQWHGASQTQNSRSALPSHSSSVPYSTPPSKSGPPALPPNSAPAVSSYSSPPVSQSGPPALPPNSYSSPPVSQSGPPALPPNSAPAVSSYSSPPVSQSGPPALPPNSYSSPPVSQSGPPALPPNSYSSHPVSQSGPPALPPNSYSSPPVSQSGPPALPPNSAPPAVPSYSAPSQIGSQTSAPPALPPSSAPPAVPSYNHSSQNMGPPPALPSYTPQNSGPPALYNHTPSSQPGPSGPPPALPSYTSQNSHSYSGPQNPMNRHPSSVPPALPAHNPHQSVLPHPPPQNSAVSASPSYSNNAPPPLPSYSSRNQYQSPAPQRGPNHPPSQSHQPFPDPRQWTPPATTPQASQSSTLPRTPRSTPVTPRASPVPPPQGQPDSLLEWLDSTPPSQPRGYPTQPHPNMGLSSPSQPRGYTPQPHPNVINSTGPRSIRGQPPPSSQNVSYSQSTRPGSQTHW
eukprot:TRINITY_DN1811_c0_g1_i1.p1 TRINITY_DN1811_c0_g1~~TRINITY_DN1811_c0_g1_i1.p1  ORF type:complete len:1282 (+),score=228.12 TRINITY_DN1811_c0_g1_i1:360-4205(+)